MKINDNYYLKSDIMNVTLYERYVTKATETKPSEEGWKSVGYFPDPKMAMRHLIRHDIMGDGMKDLEAIVKRIERLEAVIENLDVIEIVKEVSKEAV